MAEAKRGGWTEFLRDQMEVFQGRLNDFQKEADRLAADLAKKGQAQIKELERVVQGFEKGQWVGRSTELAEKAKELGGELAGHFEELQSKVVGFVGVATRDQVAELASELKRLSKKVDSIAKSSKKQASRGGAMK